jgi:NAD(P)H-hydrate epimerase
MAGRILTAAQMRWADRQAMAAGISGEALMAAAGKVVAHAAAERISGAQRVWIAAGPGNNGGDGLAAARLLHAEGIPVHVSLLGAVERLSGEARANADRALAAGVRIESVADEAALDRARKQAAWADLIVDALFGTGLSRALAGEAAALVALINDSGRPVLAVDVASGIGSDDGAVAGEAVRARWTLPIAACKWGQWLGRGRECSGVILEPADIGIPADVLDQAMSAVPGLAGEARLIGNGLIRRAFPPRPRAAHKKDFGHLWVLGGSRGYTGAPRMAAMGAFAVGTGLVSIACPEEVYPVIAAACLEAMVHPHDTAPWAQADAVVAGPGWGPDAGGRLAPVLAAGMPLVLDADALNALARDEGLASGLRDRQAPVVMTPHPGEAARLLGSSSAAVQANRLAAALQLAARFACWVVLKGADSLVVSPERRAWLCPFGTPRLAVAGTGDVLAGMIGGLIAQGGARQMPLEVAVPAAVGLHALAGESGGWYRAGQLPDRVFSLIERGVF